MDLNKLYRDEILALLILVVLVLWAGTRFLLPAAHWFEVARFDVQDALDWRSVTVDYDRTIKRAFPGEWFATVRKRTETGWEVVTSTPVRPETYRPDSTAPVPVTLEWLLWTEPRAYQLPCGEYEVSVFWTINPDSHLFRRTVERTDTFSIWGADPCTH